MRRRDGSTVRVGNPFVACAYSALAFGCEAVLFVGVIRGSGPMIVAGAASLAAVVVGALCRPELLLRAVPATASTSAPTPIPVPTTE